MRLQVVGGGASGASATTAAAASSTTGHRAPAVVVATRRCIERVVAIQAERRLCDNPWKENIILEELGTASGMISCPRRVYIRGNWMTTLVAGGSCSYLSWRLLITFAGDVYARIFVPTAAPYYHR